MILEAAGDVGTQERTIDLLVVSNIAGDAERIARWLGDPAPFQFQTASSGYKMLEILRQFRVPVVVCRTSLPDTTWKHVLITLQEFHLPPTVIVLSDSDDIDLWTEVLNQGGFDVLPKGSNSDRARQMLGQAHRRWTRREEILLARRANPLVTEAAEHAVV